MHNKSKDEDDVLETKYLSQPRGAHTGWMLRMPTPKDLIGLENAKTGRAYGKKIHEGLGTKDLKLARKRRSFLISKTSTPSRCRWRR